MAFTYRTITVYGTVSQRLRLTTRTRPTHCQTDEHARPTTPATQPLTSITRNRFRHPPRSLATTKGITYCFLLLRVLRCFTSPRTPPRPIHSSAGDTAQPVPGYPIRKPWDHSSVDNSPRPIAASHVLHRLLVPRHPPTALTHYTTTIQMLAPTIQLSTNHQTPPQTGSTHTIRANPTHVCGCSLRPRQGPGQTRQTQARPRKRFGRRTKPATATTPPNHHRHQRRQQGRPGGVGGRHIHPTQRGCVCSLERR